MNFQQLTEKLNESNVVYSKKINRIPVEIRKVGSKFETYVDGDKLDTYKSEKQAIAMAKQFIAELD